MNPAPDAAKQYGAMPQPSANFDEAAAIAAGLSHDEIEELKVLICPSKWAFVHFGWEPYDYQQSILDLLPETSSAVFRLGRRLGKTEIMCIIILWYAFTQYNKKETNASTQSQYDVLIITPYETQIDTIFKRLTELIGASATLQSSIVRHNKHDIRLNNGTTILGLTAGTKNSSGAASTRSKRADVLILDEVDYMSDEDISNVRNIRNEDPRRIRMICASTPAGKRESYYHWCTQATTSYHADGEYLEQTGILRYKVLTAKDKGIRGNGWTEFYAPSQVNRKLLEINDETQQTYLDDMKDELPSYRYDQEVLALFGEEVLGVYQKRFIDHAILLGNENRCSYADMQPRNMNQGNIRILGVDWDKIAAETSLLAYE